MNDLKTLKEAMKSNGVQRLYFKILSANDLPKSQIYLGRDLSAISIIPFNNLSANTFTKKPGFKATLEFSWLDEVGRAHRAPNAKLILYPQYPEVRMSGFLAGCALAPVELMNTRQDGRILFTGIVNNRAIMAYAASPDSLMAREIKATKWENQFGVFQEIAIEDTDYKRLVINTLTEVHKKGWIDSRKLQKDGASKPYNASNGGGYTLEAEFGVTPNGIPKPDIWGWELKNHGVTNFSHLDIGIVTLMTPEPTGGFYKDEGLEQFIRTFGDRDKRGRPDRMNFGGTHRFGILTRRTGLTMELIGFDRVTGKIVELDGGIALVDVAGKYAALWNYASLMTLWNTKHAQAAYVPSIRRINPSPHYTKSTNFGFQYRYGPVVKLGIGTDFALFLKGIATGKIYYDPGIKLENASTLRPSSKRRSQFRVKVADAHMLYAAWETVDLVESS